MIFISKHANLRNQQTHISRNWFIYLNCDMANADTHTSDVSWNRLLFFQLHIFELRTISKAIACATCSEPNKSTKIVYAKCAL
jgi:hypothetical protein